MGTAIETPWGLSLTDLLSLSSAWWELSFNVSPLWVVGEGDRGRFNSRQEESENLQILGEDYDLKVFSVSPPT